MIKDKKAGKQRVYKNSSHCGVKPDHRVHKRKLWEILKNNWDKIQQGLKSQAKEYKLYSLYMKCHIIINFLIMGKCNQLCFRKMNLMII